MATARLRLPFFILAILVIAAVVLVEHGAVGAGQVAGQIMPWLVTGPVTGIDQGIQIFSPAQAAELRQRQAEEAAQLANLPQKVDGFGIPAMQYVDVCLLFTMLQMALALIVKEAIQAKIQGILTLIFSILLILAAVVFIFMTLAKLLTMVALLLSFPFGTLVYLVVYGSFPRSAGLAVLGLLFTLKIIFAVLLLLAHEGFLKMKGLIIFLVVSFIAGLVVSFLYGLVPGILVSITDAIAGIVNAIIGVILAIILLILSIPSILKALIPA